MAGSSDNGSPDRPALPVKPDKDRPAAWFRTSSASSIGIEMAVCVLGGVLGGKWIQDNWTHWEPGTLLLGLGFGCLAATRALMRLSKQWQSEIAMNEAEQAEREAAGPDAELPQPRSSAAASLLTPLGGLAQLARLAAAQASSKSEPDSETEQPVDKSHEP